MHQHIRIYFTVQYITKCIFVFFFFFVFVCFYCSYYEIAKVKVSKMFFNTLDLIFVKLGLYSLRV